MLFISSCAACSCTILGSRHGHSHIRRPAGQAHAGDEADKGEQHLGGEGTPSPPEAPTPALNQIHHFVQGVEQNILHSRWPQRPGGGCVRRRDGALHRPRRPSFRAENECRRWTRACEEKLSSSGSRKRQCAPRFAELTRKIVLLLHPPDACRLRRHWPLLHEAIGQPRGTAQKASGRRFRVRRIRAIIAHKRRRLSSFQKSDGRATEHRRRSAYSGADQLRSCSREQIRDQNPSSA